tara:strand:+ start:743 stop:952 length:210 start_codon:yes stop_codon:yes gene_type:complete
VDDLKEAQKLVACYRRCLLNTEGEEIIKDLRKFSMIDEQAGSGLSLEEMVYRNALQDIYRYIDAMISEN